MIQSFEQFLNENELVVENLDKQIEKYTLDSLINDPDLFVKDLLSSTFNRGVGMIKAVHRKFPELKTVQFPKNVSGSTWDDYVLGLFFDHFFNTYDEGIKKRDARGEAREFSDALALSRAARLKYLDTKISDIDKEIEMLNRKILFYTEMKEKL